MLNNDEEDYVLYKGIYVRANEPKKTTDITMIKECEVNYKHFTFDDESIVLDLGANIGGFAKIVQKYPVKQYVGYEPDRSNYNVLIRNIPKSVNYSVHCCAVSSNDSSSMTFFTRNSKKSACSGTIAPINTSGTTTNIVENRSFFSVIEELKPTHLKMDIEGAERDILDSIFGTALFQDDIKSFPSSIREFAIEVHGGKYIRQFENEIHPRIQELGFSLLCSTPITGFKSAEKQTDIVFGHNINGTLFGIDLFYKRK